MILTNSVLEDIRLAVGLSKDTSDFDTELLMHVNAAVGELNQNGVGRELIITDVSTTWSDLQDPTYAEHNDSFKMAPLFVMLSTKLLFDPPPPSSVQHHQESAAKLLWRLKLAYDNALTTTTTTSNGDW